MKKNVLWLMVAAALCLTLAGCGPKTAQMTSALEPTALTPTATSIPEPTATPEPWREDPKGYIMGWLEELLDGEDIFLRFWIHPGSGPTPDKWPGLECAAEIREMFENMDWDNAKLLTWEEQNAEDESWVNIPGAYSVTLHDDDWGGEGYFGLDLNSRVIRVQWGDNYLYFRVLGAEELCTKITDLDPSPYLNLGRVRVPAQETERATLKLYLETALERTKELGHITDYELRHYAVVTEWLYDEERWVEEDESTPAEEEGEHLGFCYTATYAYKPANPESEFWKHRTFDENGWLVETVNGDGPQDFLSYDERDRCYGML